MRKQETQKYTDQQQSIRQIYTTQHSTRNLGNATKNSPHHPSIRHNRPETSLPISPNPRPKSPISASPYQHQKNSPSLPHLCSILSVSKRISHLLPISVPSYHEVGAAPSVSKKFPVCVFILKTPYKPTATGSTLASRTRSLNAAISSPTKPSRSESCSSTRPDNSPKTA